MSIIWDIEKTIDIGYQNEHNARMFAFDISDELEKWPSASPHIVVQRPGDTKAVRGESKVDGNTIVWTVTRKDTQLNGNGKVWVAFIDGEDLLGYSFAANIVVHDAPDIDDIVEEEVVSPWIEQIREYLESAQAYAQASLDAAKRAEDAAKKAEELGGNVSADMLEEVVDAYMQDHPPAEIVDNLTTNESTKALSAAQGVKLKSQIDEIANDVQSGESAIVKLDETLSKEGMAADAKATGDALKSLNEEKADKYLGIENAGAALIVGADGNIAVLVEDAGGEQLTVVAPVQVYEACNIYIVSSTGKLFVADNQYISTAVYQVSAGKRYRFSASSKNSITTTYALAEGVYAKPESGYGPGIVYSYYKTENPNTYDYEIVPESDCYLYIQYDSNKGIDAENNLFIVTAGVAKKEEYPLYAVSSDGSDIEISYPYGDDTLTVRLNKRGGNNLFDFRSIKTTSETLFDALLSDWHAPFVVAAVNNADGDTPTNQYFTGGSHQTNNQNTGGAVTARTSALTFYADGKLLSADESGHADRIEMRWTNLVQGYNTTKADGSGREILQENHTLIFVNGKFEAYVEIIPLEAVTMKTYYGLQAVMTSKWANIRYPGGTNRAEYTGESESGDSTAYIMDCHGDAHRMRIEIDHMLDLGRRTEAFANGTKGAFSADYGKCYFTIVNKDVSMAAGDMYCLRGSYEFTPR